jgi:hypothetical protein
MQLDTEWRNAAPLIRLAQKRIERKASMQDVYDEIERGQNQLWIVRKEDRTTAAMTTTIEQHPRATVFKILLIGGFDMQEWLMPALNVIKDAAKKLGCDTIEADGRLGWAKHAPKCGFKEITRTYELEI